ncbi:MAG: glycosyltransferase family 9 protein [Thermosphaera sp.]
MVVYYKLNIFQKLALYAILCFPSLLVGMIKKILKIGNIINKQDLKVSSILVFQLGHLGDICATVPLISCLKKYFPQASISLCTGSWNREFAHCIKGIDEILVYDNPFLDRRKRQNVWGAIIYFIKFISYLRKKEFSIAMDTRGHINSLYPLYLSKAKLTVGFSYKGQGIFLDRWIAFNPRHTEKYEADRLLLLLNILPLKRLELSVLEECPIVVHEEKINNMQHIDDDFIVTLAPSAPWPPERWPEENFAQLADKILFTCRDRVKKLKIILVGAESDEPVLTRVEESSHDENDIKKVVCRDINELITILKKTKIFICHDSGPLHLAYILGIPTISLFGPGNWLRWSPRGKKHICIKASVPCSPCKEDLTQERCKKPTNECMKKIKVEEVMIAFVNLFEQMIQHEKIKKDINLKKIRKH